MAHFGIRVGEILGLQSTVDRFPRLTCVVRTESAGGRDGDKNPSGIAWIEKNSVQAHSTGAWLPLGPCAVAAQPGQLLPRLSAVGRAEQGGVFHPGVNTIRIGQRRFEMPDALELPGVLRAVVKLMRGEGLAGFWRCVVDEFVALAARHAAGRGRHSASGCFPRLATVARALDDLSKPAAGLRCIEAVRIGGRALHVVDLPARKVGATDLPPFALAVRCQDERALARADQYSYAAHFLTPFCASRQSYSAAPSPQPK